MDFWGLIENLLGVFHDWTRSDILALLAIVVPSIGLLLGFIIAARRRRHQHTKEICQRIKSFYQDKIITLGITEVAERDAKLLFYQGRSRRTALENVLLGFSAERDICSEIFDTLSEWDGKSPLHIDIVGDRKQGKSILLAQIAARLSKSDGYTVLMKHETPSDESFDFELLKDYLRMQRGRVQRIAVLIDDFLAYHEQAVTPRKSAFLHKILSSGLPILLVTSSHAEVGTIKSVKYELFLTPTDEERIISKLKEPPALIPSSLTVTSIRGMTGGYRIYKGELMAFLSLLVQEVAREENRFVEGLMELDLELYDVSKTALKYIAACQLIDVELPSGILRYVIPEVNIDRAVSDVRGWIRLKPLSYTQEGRGLSLGAPYFAAYVLDSFHVSNKSALEELFVDIFKRLAKKRITDWLSYEGEFVRHILYRLAKRRHFRFHGVDGIELAQSLYQRFSQVLLEYIKRKTDTSSLSLWIATLARLGQQEQIKPMCLQILQILEQLACSSERLDEQAFVALALALNRLTDSDVREKGLAVLDLQWLMQHSADLPTEEKTRRINQAIHAYCNLLKNLGRFEEALSVLENIPTKIKPDALTTLLKAEVMGILGDARADDTYAQAIGLAEEVVRRSPGMMVECLLMYGDFLQSSFAWGDLTKRPELPYSKAAGCMKYSPEKYQNVLSSWAQSISEEDPGKAFNLCQESLEIDRQNQTVHVNSHVVFAQLLLNHWQAFYERAEDAYQEAECVCREVLDYPYVEFPEKARVYRLMGEHLVGSKSYVWERKKRPDFSEAENLLLKAFESDSKMRNDDTHKTLADSLAHRSLARFYWHWSTKYPDQSKHAQLADKAIFHFTKSYSGLPRRDLDSLNVRLNVLNCQYQYILFKRDRRESVLPECVEVLELLKKWRLYRMWYKTWAFLSIYIDALCQADIGIIRGQFDKIYHQIKSIISTNGESLSRLIILTTNKLMGRAFTLVSSGQVDIAQEYLNKAFNVISQHLENNPEDTKVAQMVSKIVIGKRQREVEGNQDRIDKALELTKRVVSRCLTNEGAIESLLRIADILPREDQRLIELENMLDQVLNVNESMVHTLQNVLHHLKGQGYWVTRGRLTKRLLRYMKNIELVNSRTK